MFDLRLSKLLGQVLDPLAIIWILLFCISLRYAWLKQRRRSLAWLSLWAWIWCVGATPLSSQLLARLERPYLPTPGTALQQGDAVICLGGAMFPQAAEALDFTANDACDRYLTALDLLQSGRVEHLVIGGSEYMVQGQATSEGKLLKQWKERWQIGAGTVHLMEHCQSTRDEAVRVAALLEEHAWERIYLVTSAWHMRRSLAVFAKHGVDAEPLGCDFRGTTGNASTYRWKLFPQSTAFANIQLYLHEIVGYYYYQWRGWI